MPDHPEPPDRPVPAPPREAVQRWRLLIARSPLEGDPGQREQLAAWERALAASGLPVAGLDAVPPKPRFAIAAPLAVAIGGEAELVDVWLTERVPVWRVREALIASLPEGHRLRQVQDVWLGEAALPGQVVASVYRVTFATGTGSGADLDRACRELLSAASLPRERPKGQATVRYDLRPFLGSLEVADAGAVLRMTLRHDPERGIGRPEEVLAALGERLGEELAPAALVRESLVLAEPPTAPPAGPRTGARGGPRRGPAPTGRARAGR